MKKLPLSPKFIPWIVSGKKTSTIRLGTREYTPGAATIVSRNAAIPIEILEVKHSQVECLNEQNAHEEGYDNKSDLMSALREFYPSISDSDEVTIIRFRRK